MTNISNIFTGEVKMNDNLVIKEYRLMYFFGCWMTATKLYAEDDNEALFDAKFEMEQRANKGGNPLRYALFCGHRKVAELQQPTFQDGLDIALG